ncbi:MAG: carboxypeptidase-like regulatory domain-containing protein, partial [Ignavibacteriaceae bacterium]|nr:carboxypeptidase-like regulatory domain-containing protein [Ignavibacteriaceae bacterium]
MRIATPYLKYLRILLILPLLIFTVSNNLNAQGQRGKIAGTVVDAVTGDVLIGANVIVQGTTLGAASDFDGRFVILNVPPGVYTVSASLVGFAKTSIEKVEVVVDRTTTLNFKLQEGAVQIDQVVVVAEKPKIIKDQTSTSSTIDDAQITSAPVEGLRG